MNRFAAIGLIALLLLWPLGLVSGQAQAPPASPVVVPAPSPETLGANVTTFTAGGALLAAWEFLRRVVLPRLSGPGPDAPPPSPPPPGPAPSSQLLELLRLILERLLQPQPMPLMQTVPAATIRVSEDSLSAMPQKAPDWAHALLEEIRALRKPA